MGIQVTTNSYYNNSTGLNLRDSPTKLAESDASLTLNQDYSVDGAFFTRNGSTVENDGHPMAQLISLGSFDYIKSDGTQVNVLQNGSVIYQGMTNPASTITGLNATVIPDMEFQVTNDDEYLVWGNGIDTNLKFNGTTWTNLSLPHATAPTLTDLGVGVLPAGDYYYYVSFARTVGGVIVEEGELSPISSVVTIAINREIRVTIPVCSETLATGVTAQCNARVIYRISPTSLGIPYRITTVADNTTLTYDDNTAADGTILADFNKQAAPTSAIIEEYLGCMNYVDASSSTDLYESTPNYPWNVPSDNFEIFDGPIQCVKRIYGVLIIGTDKSIWVRNGRLADGAESKRISSTIGILNNRCADGLSYLYFLGTNLKVYNITPTDFANDQIRLDEPLSRKIEPLISGVTASAQELITTKYYTKADVAKWVISVPIGSSTNSKLIIYNETQAHATQNPVWEYWDNINASSLQMFNITGNLNLYSGDYNGYFWKLDDDTTHGDGAEENGTVTSATSTIITDSTQAWTINAFKGRIAHFIDGYGADQSGTITANTATTFTLASALTTTPNTTTVYTIGGYDAYHFTNWKSVTGSYDALKQLWFVLSNLNASGDYSIQLIIQYDFNQSLSDQTSLNINLLAGNAIWGEFEWLAGVWGSQQVFQDRIRQFGRFRAIRFGFRNQKAGQPFQVNGYSISSQDKGLFFKISS